jgi:hypothetical protein
VLLPHIFGEQYFAVSQNNTLHIFSHGIQIEAAEVVPHQQPLGSSENQIERKSNVVSVPLLSNEHQIFFHENPKNSM